MPTDFASLAFRALMLSSLPDAFETVTPPSAFQKLAADANSPEVLSHRVNVLTRLVISLLAEVEALRSAQLASPQAKEAYVKAWLETNVLVNNSADPSTGQQKLLDRWFASDAQVPEEAAMLKRLGLDEEAVKQNLAQVDAARERT